MRTITIELPDDTPIISLMEFAAQIKCDMKLVEHNRFRFHPHQANTTCASNIAHFPARGRAIRQPGPGAA